MILVVGSTGFLGSDICRRLVERGQSVRALVRKTSDSAKVDYLKALGVQIVVGDLQDRNSLDAACAGIEAVITTATAVLSQQPSDSIESTDCDGQLNLVAAASATGVKHFIFVSYSKNIDCHGDPAPLTLAKRSVEAALQSSGMTFTILRPSYFMEVWLSPILGFDFPSGKATLYGSGHNAISWISLGDVAEFAAQSIDTPAAENAVIELGGPQALSPLEVVKIFEEVSGKSFELSNMPVDMLESQKATASDALQRSFAALMLSLAEGDQIDMRIPLKQFSIRLTSVEDYAHRTIKS